MIFADRHDAGQQLGNSLLKYSNLPHTLVLALPRGGVVIGHEIAKILNLPLDIICPRKVGAPYNKEIALGAVTDTGTGYFNQEIIAASHVDPEYLASEIAKEKLVSAKRMRLYRGNKPPLNLENKTVIIADDGIATGATMKAAIQSCKDMGAIKIIVAIPVGPPSTISEIFDLADDVICLQTPTFFMAVGQFYDEFEATEDDEVISLLQPL